MGQCVIKDCGFNVQKLNEPERRQLNQFLKDRIKDRYSTLEKPHNRPSQNTHSSLAHEENTNNLNFGKQPVSSFDEYNHQEQSSNSQNEKNEIPPRFVTKESSNQSTCSKNLQKYKDLTLNGTFLKNKHFFTPKASEEDPLKTLSREKLKSFEFEKKKLESSPKSTAIQTENNDRKFQNGFQNNYFHPPESPNRTPTPTKVEFGNIFTEEELSDISGELENFEKKFPQEVIEKYSKKSRIGGK